MTARFDVAVIGRAGDAAAGAADAACGLTADSDSGTAIVVTTGPLPGGVVAPPSRAAARLRDRLLARELEARAGGRIVWCAAGDTAQAARAAAVGVPVVLAICCARTDWTDELLADAAHVLVAGDAADPLVALVLLDLQERGLSAAVVMPPAGVRAGLTRLGLTAPTARRSLASPSARAAT